MVGIYKIICESNGSVYVGSSSDIKKRWSSHKSKIKKINHNPKINNCIKKYGKDNFSFHIIEECSVVNLIEREQFWADDFKGNGFRLLNCGEFVESPSRGVKLSQDRINKMKDSLKGNKHTLGRKLTEEHKKNISKALLGHKMSDKNKKILYPFTIRKKSKADKQKISKSRIEKYGVKIICLQTNEVFNSLIEASIKTKASYQSIRQSIIRGGKCQGLNYYYLDNKLSIEEKEKLINTNLRNNKKNNKSNHKELCRQQTGKKVYCVEIDKKFISISEASEYFNVSSTTIRNY